MKNRIASYGFFIFATYKISEKIYFSGLFSSLMLCIKTIYSTHSVFITALFKSADYFPLIPWLFMFLFGAVFGKYAKEEKFSEFAYKSHSSFFSLSEKTACGFILRISLPFTQLCISSNYLYNELCRRYFGFYACIIV